MAYFSFAAPLYLNFLFAIPLIILIHVWTLRIRGRRAIKFANIEAIERVSGVEIFSRNLTLMFFHILVVVLLVVALAGTQFHVEKKASSFSYVIALDASPSMLARDLLPTRFIVAKQAAKDFVNILPLGTKVGVISFSGVSYIELGMSEDKVLLRSILDSLEIKAVGGTNILDAVITSVNVMEDEENKAVVLLSDGQLNVYSLEDILKYAKKNEVVIHAIGVGTLEGGEAENFISKIDEDVLKALAFNTGGKYYHSLSSEDLKKAFEDVAVSTVRIVGIQLSVYALIGSLILLVIEWLLLNTKWRGIP